ncbi:MAG: hypothetical protein FJX02_14795 [Alphaproteobacteria bacterium]|nr:hypothetical protein [Alphaproteobacteria bacterium]
MIYKKWHEPMTALEAVYHLRFKAPDHPPPPCFSSLTRGELFMQAWEELFSERQLKMPPPPSDLIAESGTGPWEKPLRRPTPARLRTRFLRCYERTGMMVEAAARAGVAVRTVQRWREKLPKFAARLETARGRRREMLEELAEQRASAVVRKPVFHQGNLIANDERYNDIMLMRVLGRFDRAEDRAIRRRELEAAIERGVARAIGAVRPAAASESVPQVTPLVTPVGNDRAALLELELIQMRRRLAAAESALLVAGNGRQGSYRRNGRGFQRLGRDGVVRERTRIRVAIRGLASRRWPCDRGGQGPGGSRCQFFREKRRWVHRFSISPARLPW